MIRRIILPIALLVTVFLMAGCGADRSVSDAGPTPDATQTFAAALAAAERALIPSATPQPSATLTAPPTLTFTPSPTPTAPPLPEGFETSLFSKAGSPVTYLEDTCEVIGNRWKEGNAAPGTTVMIVMFHSIKPDSKPLAGDGSDAHHSDVVRAMEAAQAAGFTTITTAQLADFLERNAYIPPRSMVLIVDDRKRAEYYETHFIPLLKRFGWTLTNAWISAPDTPDYLYKENQAVIDAGWVDPQAHGVVHNIPMSDATDDAFMRNELQGAMAAIETHYGRSPVGFIWPGGGFTRRSVELAREAGYRVGFTTNPRGPVMFNWIPQADKLDANHPNWLPEMGANDPLMTLPRFWSSEMEYRLPEIVALGHEAAAYYAQVRETELAYYVSRCTH